MEESKDISRIPVRHLWFLMGSLSIGAQVLSLRASIVVFSGNEVVVGPMLFAWTIWIGVGSFLGGKYKGRDRRTVHVLFLAAAVLLPCTYLSVKAAKIFFGIHPAEIVNPFRSFIFFVCAFAPLCVVLGAMFSACCRLGGSQSGGAVARTYLWDALGAAFGGLCAGGLLIPALSGDRAVFFMVAVTAAVMLYDSRKTSNGCRLQYIVWGSLALVATVLVAWDVPTERLNETARGKYPVMEERDSRYSRLALVRTENEYTLFVNGMPSLSYPGGLSEETLAYLAMAANPNAARVLLIGGSMTSVGKKILDGPVKELDYCRIDPTAIEMEKTIPSDVWGDSRIRLRVEDGRRFLRNVSQGSYDLIVMDVGDPYTLAQNRYYTVEFFGYVKKALTEGGAIVFAVSRYANYVGDEQALFLSSIESALLQVFEHRRLYPLNRFYFAASGRDVIPRKASSIISRLSGIGVEGEYFRYGNLEYDLAEHRYEPYNAAKERVGPVSPNRDYRPSGYAFRTATWLGRFKAGPGVSSRLLYLPAWVPWVLLSLVASAVILFFMGNRGKRAALSAMIFGIGFAGMAFEVAILYSVQIMFGGLYGYVGCIVTAYMVGLSLGAWFSQVLSPGRAIRCGACAVAVALLIPVFTFGPLLSRSGEISAMLIVTLLLLTMSVSCGLIFGAVARVMGRDESDAGGLGGSLNFADLTGAALGAPAMSVLAIPLWGVGNALGLTLLLFAAGGVSGVIYTLKKGFDG